eukprot:TRINITY_DN104048_c0_g1_i1.p1 TRINITY_DN104048_c0_g1~~TRINITY_DN104048_c0_g1_i1.p1  ORF type:complete len:447 (+),score=82.82 TRINITY_DN104048_c0_g1_i1:71-1411(+)
MSANCTVACSIGCLYCCKGCSAEKLRNQFTFLPPRPSYAVLDGEGTENSEGGNGETGEGRGKLVYKMEVLRKMAVYRSAAEACEVHWVVTKVGNRIPVVWVKPAQKTVPSAAAFVNAESEVPGAGGRQATSSSAADSGRLVLLHCHGNATDVGMMMAPFYELAWTLGIEVAGVEYSGYGAAKGKPSESNTYADIEAAFDYLVKSGVPPERIVAYGQSVGSGPVSRLASSRQLGGLILHSPLMSGIKVIDPSPDRCCRPSCIWSCFDFFPNYRRLRTVKCPVLIMHGKRDEVIPFYHAQKLAEVCPAEARWPPYFHATATHNDLVEVDQRRYYSELSGFLRAVVEGKAVEICKGGAAPSREVRRKYAVFDRQDASADAVTRQTAGALGPDAAAGQGGDGAEERARADAAASFLGLGSAPQPTAGPEDGRYEQMRGGRLGRALQPSQA